MLSLIHTFVEYLAAELPAIPVHWLRKDPTNPDANRFHHDALNVTVLGYPLDKALVSLDIIASSESQAAGWAGNVVATLRAQQFTPEMDYSSGTPTATGGSVTWDDAIMFDYIEAEPNYAHLVCTLTLQHGRLS